MPESGDIEVLRQPSITDLPGRRRVALRLDLSSLSDDFHVAKRCKLESMNFTFSGALKCNSNSVGTRTMQPQDLAAKLNKSKPVLLLDCRPFVSFNIKHIKGAINVNCSDRFNRKRLQQGKVGIVDLVTSKEGKDIFKRRGSKEIILYDDHTSDIHQLPSETSLHLVLSSLIREGKEAFVLKGGLEAFVNTHSELCDSSVKSQENRPLYSPTTAIIEPQIETAVASKVLPFLYLGNERDAADLQRIKELDISYVLNITSHVPKYFEGQGIKYKRLPASDSACQNLRQYFEEGIEFIDEARQNGANILVHCHAGVSRSATLTIAYILKHSKMTMMDTYRYVKGKRAIISPNFNFMGQLMEFEQSLNQGTTKRILHPQLQGVESAL